MENKKYAVIRDAEYYSGDCLHPNGWDLTVETDEDNFAMIGSLDECQEWMDELDEKPHYLGNNEAGYTYRIAEVLDDDACYNTWLDNRNWDNCPSDDGEDYDANVAWAETKAYTNNGTICIPNPNTGKLLLVDLSSSGE